MKKYRSILLLVIIYITFIALGLPDALLGSGWNLIRSDLNISLETLGVMTVTVYVMSILATFNAPRILRWLETKWITFISVLMTGVALILLSQVSAFYQMLFFALPLGVGAGAIDVSLNHYLASHYQAKTYELPTFILRSWCHVRTNDYGLYLKSKCMAIRLYYCGMFVAFHCISHIDII